MSALPHYKFTVITYYRCILDRVDVTFNACSKITSKLFNCWRTGCRDTGCHYRQHRRVLRAVLRRSNLMSISHNSSAPEQFSCAGRQTCNCYARDIVCSVTRDSFRGDPSRLPVQLMSADITAPMPHYKSLRRRQSRRLVLSCVGRTNDVDHGGWFYHA